jgi:cytoskeleton-associated protein 5
MFSHIVSQLTSKNARVRAECLEELGCLIQRNGSSVFTSAKALPLIAAQISDRDNTVRTAALNTMVQAYALLGDNIYKHITKLTEKDRSLLEERIKRSKVVAPPGTTASTSPSKPTRVSRSNVTLESSSVVSSTSRLNEPTPSELTGGETTKKFTLDLDTLNLPQLSSATHTQVTLIPSVASFEKPQLTRNPSGLSVGDPSEYAMDFILTQVTSGDVFQSIDALKQLEKFISTQPELVQTQINPLVNAVTLQVRLAFTSPVMTGTESATLLRLCKHLVNALVQMFSSKMLTCKLTRDTTHQLLSELLSRLVDQSLQMQLGENGTQLTRALNVLMIRILENCDKNIVFRYVYRYR